MIMWLANTRLELLQSLIEMGFQEEPSLLNVKI